MEKSNITEWLDNLLRARFDEVDKAISHLTSLDLFYLYLEIYKKYTVKLPISLLELHDLDFELIVDSICKTTMRS